MAYVPVPRDLTKIRVKILFGLTLRQLVCFGSAAAVGVPVYFLTRGSIGNSAAVLLMIGVMLPAFFVSMYEKDGQPAEKILINFVRSRWFFPATRPYRTENFYSLIDKEVKLGPQTQKETAASKKASAAKTKRETK
jgi:hypothetical protein